MTNLARKITRILYLVLGSVFAVLLVPLVLASVIVAVVTGAIMFAVDAGGAWAFQNRSIRQTWNEWCK
jgi:hypothetical protein